MISSYYFILRDSIHWGRIFVIRIEEAQYFYLLLKTNAFKAQYFLTVWGF